jgi:3beta-hydroxy-delta5-steroid dehydrogenase/steroid delta-isomerase
MNDTTSPQTVELGHVLVTGGAGFVGQNFVQSLLDKGLKVRAFDLAPCPLEHENLEKVQGNICDVDLVEEACKGIDTIFHTAAIIELKGGKAVTQEYRERSYAINVEGTKNIVKGAWKNGTRRLVYTASNSVVIGGEPIKGGTETMPYTRRYNDLYTETKVVAEQWVLQQDGKNGLNTCSIRPSGIWGPGDQTMFRHFFDQMIAGLFKATVGDKNVKLDNSYVHNLIHGQILAAQHLGDKGTANGQAYFINDGDPVNMFEFARPVMAAVNCPFPKFNVPYWLVKAVMVVWQQLHFKFKFPEPPLPPLAIERVAIDNYFSIDKARKDLGYEPLYTTQDAMNECLPYYVEMYNKMKAEAGK